MQTEQLSQLQSEQTELKREIGVFGGVNVLAGIMIGSGIFYLGSYVLMYSGMSQKLALIVWGIGGVFTLLCGLCYAELGAMMPKAGGSYVYLREAYGTRVGFMSGFSGFILGNSGSNAALAVALINILRTFFPMGPWASKFAAIAFILVLSAINYRGVKLGSMVQNVFNVAKLLPIGLILFAGLLYGKQTLTPNIVPDGVGAPQLLSMVALGVVATLWAYEGWTNLNVITEEMKNPKRNLPLAIIIAISFVTVLYVLFNYSIYRVLPFSTIQAMIGNEDYYLGTQAANVLFGNTGQLLVGIGMFIAVFGALNGCIMVFPRYYYSMAKDGLLLPALGKIHPKHKTPAASIVVSALVSCIMVLFLGLGDLTQLVTFSALAFNTLTLYSVIIFRKKYPTMERPYKVWFYPASVIVTIIVMIGLLFNSVKEQPLIALLNLIVPLIGLVIHEIQTRGKKQAITNTDPTETE